MDNLNFTARKVCDQLGYDRWENFHNLILRAQNLINNGEHRGEIRQTVKQVSLGKGATREIIDYCFDENAFDLINNLSTSYKVNSFYSIRNETTMLTLLKKYCNYKEIPFKFQYRLPPYVFDCLVGESVLLEFDEPHHKSKRSLINDKVKEQFAVNNGYKVFRFELTHDIVDVISKLRL